jgi:hypothetical protein
MNKELLKKHVYDYIEKQKKSPLLFAEELEKRNEITIKYQSYTKQKLLSISEEQLYEYLSVLWAMLIWGNKHYVIDKIINDNGLKHLQTSLADLVWGNDPIEKRWDSFRKGIKGMGPAMISEILCRTHPDKYIVWNRRAYVALNYLGVKKLPRYDYQFTGDIYKYLCDVELEIAAILRDAGQENSNLMAVDYFIWDELQFEDNLKNIYEEKPKTKTEPEQTKALEFIHNDIRDKLKDIGVWLGLSASTEQKVAEGSKVDTIWEATIGNMGRVIYVFEVQTKGSIDSLVLNLLKSLNNPAVQGVVAVSDKKQLEEIKKQVREVAGLSTKLKYWDYEEVLRVHESLAFINESINNLHLVPEGF